MNTLDRRVRCQEAQGCISVQVENENPTGTNGSGKGSKRGLQARWVEVIEPIEG
ncbi:MAG: hypothetical protein WAO41_01215 [Candidatus Nanopelagicales bacterium]